MNNANVSSSLAAAVSLSLCLLGAVGCREDGPKATAQMIDSSGADVGTATLRQIDEGVLLLVDLHDLPPGAHAMHIHEHGTCTAPSFESAGDHFNPLGKGHGLADRTAEGAHAGDLVDIIVDDAGNGHAYRVVESATLNRNADESSVSLLREGGTAVVIHAQPDDNRSDPAGNAGSRLACGVIQAEDR